MNYISLDKFTLNENTYMIRKYCRQVVDKSLLFKKETIFVGNFIGTLEYSVDNSILSCSVGIPFVSNNGPLFLFCLSQNIVNFFERV